MIYPAAFQEIEVYLEQALTEGHGEYLLEDIQELVDQASVKAYKIVNDEGFTVGGFLLEQVDFPRCRALRVPLLGGEGWEHWGAELDKFLVEVAQAIRASQIRGFGRPGWSRALKSMGYESASVPIKEI